MPAPSQEGRGVAADLGDGHRHAERLQGRLPLTELLEELRLADEGEGAAAGWAIGRPLRRRREEVDRCAKVSPQVGVQALQQRLLGRSAEAVELVDLGHQGPLVAGQGQHERAFDGHDQLQVPRQARHVGLGLQDPQAGHD